MSSYKNPAKDKPIAPDKLKKIQEKKQLLKSVFQQADHEAKHFLFVQFMKWKSEVITKKIDASRISLKIKAQILLNVSKYEGATTLHEAFLRWKIRADPSIVKQAVDQFMLYSRINEYNVLQRLKAVLPTANSKKKMDVKKRKNLAVLSLALALQRKQLKTEKEFLEQIKPKPKDSSRLLGLLALSINSKLRNKLLYETMIKWNRNAKLKSERLQKQLRKLEKLGMIYGMKNAQLERALVKKAYNQWKDLLTEDRLRKKFFSVLLKTTFGRLQKCYHKWEMLPDVKLMQKKKSGQTLINRLKKRQGNKLRIAWSAMKAIHDDAKNKKIKVLRELIEVTFNQSHTAFYKWANYNTYAKLTETNLKKIKAIKSTIDMTQDIVKQNTVKLFTLGRKVKICSYLARIVKKIKQRQCSEAIHQIKDVVHIKDLKRQLKKFNTKELVETLQNANQTTGKGRLRLVLKTFYQNRKQNLLKKLFFQKILSTTQGQVCVAIDKWKTLPDHDKFNKLTNQYVLLNDEILKSKLIGWIKTGSKYNNFVLGEVMHRFYQNRQQSSVKQRALQKIKKSTLGQLLKSFDRWRGLPFAKGQNNGRASKFEQSLLKISIKFWRHNAWNPLQEAYDDALAVKKRAMLLLYKSQESEMQKVMTNWHHNIKLQDEVRRCKLVISLFNQLNMTARGNLGLLQVEQSRKKEKALDKIQANLNLNLRDAFSKWRNYNQIAKIQDAMTSEKKKVLLATLDKFAHNSKNAQIRLILLRFKKNASIASIQDAFFKKLFQTKAGGLLNSFNKWKNLPLPKDNEALKKARKFERGLENLLHGSLKSTFDPLKELYYEALNAKRQCLKKMFEKSMSSHKRLFLHWAQYNRTAKQIQACQLTADFFFALQKTVQAGIAPVLQNPREAQLKEYILKLMIQGQQGNLSHAFHKWKNTTAQDILSEDLQGEKKKFLIDKLQDFQTGNQKEQLRQILAKFAFAARRVRLVKDINLKLMKTFGGQVFDSFNKWKSIPQAPQNSSKASKFEHSLLKLSIKFWRHNAWNPLQEAYDDALAIKKRAMLLLYKTQESEMQRTVTQWHHNIKLQDEVKRCKLVIFLFDQLSKTTKDNLGLLHQDEQSRKKEKALDKIQANCNINLRDAFNKWRNNNQIARIQDALTFEKKKVLLETLDKFAHNSKNAQIRLILLRFKKNASIASIQDAFFKKLFQTKAGGLLNSFNKWKNLPLPKDNEALKKARKFERGLENLLHGSLKSTFDPLKELYYEALNAKRQCLKKMFEKSMSSHKRLFLHWAQYNRTAKQIQACQLTADFFFALQKTVQAGIAPVLQNPREAQLKEYILKLMIQGQQGNLSHAFHKWKNTTAQDILSEDLQGEKKKFLIDKLQDFQTGNQKEQLRQILAKFAFAARRVRLVKDINLKLMKTFGGQVFDSFNKWKSIPQAPQNSSKASKFEHSLLKLSIKFWRHNAWNPLQEAYDDALAIKKRAMLLLYKTQESEMQRTVTQWHHNIKLQDEVKRCKLVIFLFDQLSKTTKDNLGLLHQDEQSRKKEKALDKIQANCNINLRDAFNKWRNNNQIARIQDALTFEKKKVLLETLDKFAHNSKNAQIRLILLRFKKNASIASIQDAFFKKLFQTKAGGLLNSFNKWKNLPLPKDNEALKKARKFERGLENLLHGSLKSTFDPLKELYYEALNAKRQCLKKMFEKSMSSHKRLFLHWAQYNRTAKQISACQLTADFFFALQKTVQAGIAPVLQNPREAQLKEYILKLMIQGQQGNLSHAFHKWKNTTAQDILSEDLQGEKKKFLIDKLQDFQTGNQKEQLRQILAKFAFAARRVRLVKDINLKLMKTFGGQVFDSFNKWKSIPQAPQNHARASKFEQSLLKISIKFWRHNAWNPLQEAYDDALAIKKRAMLLLYKTQESEMQRTVTQWHHNIKLQDEVKRCKLVIFLFDQLSKTTKDNLGLLHQDEQSRKKEKALDKIQVNCNINLRDAFNKWRNNTQIARIQDALTFEKKKVLLETLDKFAHNSKNAQIRLILLRFKKNASIASIQDAFFKKLFQTKAGGLLNSFNKWKNLPLPKDNEALKKARKFERGLENLLHGSLKSTFDPLKELYYEALNAKRQCLKKMFEKSMSSHKRLFLHWAQYNRTAKQIQACQLTADFFFALQKTVQAGIAPVLQNPREAQLKEYILKLMIQGQQGNLSHAFHKWKNTTAQDILSEDLQGEKKKFLIDKLQDFQTGNQKEQLRQILAKFAFAARRVRLVKDINLKLMKTFGGQVFDSFNKWKSIPQAPQNNAKASKFEHSLLKISIKFWKHNAWNPLQEAYDDALAIKKRAMLLLYKTQESEMQRTVTQWHHNIKLQDEVKRCKLVIFLFDQLNKTTKDNLGLLHQDEQSRKKEKALDKIQVNCNINLRDAFNKWRNNNQIARIQDALTFEKKKVLLETLDKFAHNSKNAQIRLILLRFKKNASIASIQDAFFKKLFQTKAGGLLNSFNKWKNLPLPKDNEALKKARKFERGLENLLHGSLKSTFDPLKELYYEALNAKRQCLKKMFEKSMSSHKRLFLHWAQYNRTAKQIQACQLTADFFFALQKTVQAGIAPVLQNPREAQLKEYILKLMIQGQQGNLSHAFHKWKNTTAQDILSEDLQGEKKKFLIDKLQDFQTGNQKEQLRQILAKFAFAARRVRLVKDINLKLMKTFGGQVFDSFNRWKSIPQAPQNHARASKFEQSLLKISIKFWRHNAWNPLQEAYDDALAIKKRAMLLLYKTQESEMQRTVTQWHHNIKLQDEVKRCKLVIFLFDQLSKTTKDNLGLLHQDEQSRKKEKALDKIQVNCNINLRDAFNKWRNNNQIARIQDALTFEKKKVLLETLDKFAHNSKNAQIRLILLRFKKNASIASIQDAFFKKLFQTKAGGLLNSFNKWKNLPLPKDNEALKKARKFERGLENLLHGSLKSTFDPLKELYYEALNAKRQCLKKMFEKSMSSHKRLFLHWAQYNRTAKQIQACQLTADFFFALQKTVQAGIAPVLQNPREAQLKEYILKLMIQGQQGNLSHAFHKWKNTTAQDILSEDLQGEKKKFLIDKLQDFQTGNQKEQLRQILAKFAFAARRVRLVKDINLKLMKTFGGQVFDSFNKWKSIPQAPQNNAKASKFEHSLLKISIKFWKHNAWNPLQEAYDDALAIKKRAMLLLYKTQESEMQRTVTQWHHNIKLQDEVKRCKLVIFLFDQLNKTTKDNLGLLHQDEQSRKKEKALDKIQVNCNINLRDAFNKWRNNNQIARIQDALTFEKKKVLLETLDKFAHNSKNAQIRLILLRFKKNASIASIQDAFFKKLFQTKAGGLLNSFNKWKNLPLPKDNEALKKARKFERGLENLLHGSLKSTFDPLKELYYEALNAKRQCLKKMFEKSMSSHKRLFLHWAQYNRTAKQIQACQLTADFFFALQKTVQAGIAPVLQNPREAQLKEYILKLMIQGQQGNLSHAFHKWKNTTAQDILSEDLQGEKKKFLIDKLQDFQTGNQKEQLRQILAKFAFAARRVRLVKDINLKLMKTFGGQVFDSFNRWKSIPQAPQNHARASKFEQSLLKISIKFWRHNAWNPLQEAYDDALAIKKRAMLLLYKTQESEMQRTVTQWHHNIKLQDEVKRCKLVIFLFDQLNKTTKDNLGLLHQDEQSRKKEKALDKIQVNCNINLRDAFNKWRNNNQIARIQDALTFEKKKVLLETLDKFAHNSKNAQIRLILLRFKKNASIASIQDAFFKKLFQTKAGGLLNSFNKWKNLPLPKDNEALKKARKFERGLENLLHGSLKSTFDPLKELYYEALNAKRQCLKKMFEKSMSSHKRLFLHWAQYNRTAKQIQACQLTADFFFALQKTVQAGIAPVLQNPREAQLKEYILKLMIQGQQGNLSHAFHKWKNTTAQDILSEDLQGEKKKFLIDKLQDFQTGNQKEQLRQILAKFAFAARRVRLVKDINLKLMKTFGGQVFDSFNKWKSIPQAPQNNAKASKFEHSLLKISIKFWKHNAWNPLQEAYDDALAIKKRAMLLLYKTQESEMQRTVTQWHHNIKLQDEVKRCKLVIFLFDQLNKTTKDNLGLLHQDEQSRKKEKALDKIQVNCNINLRDAFNKWRNNNQIARIQDALTFEKKKVLLETLDKFAHNSKNAQIRLILLRFKKNASIASIQDAFFKKLFQTKAGGLLNSFNKWKNLPLPKDNEALKKARKFERGLENLLHGSLKSTFDPLKELYYEALNAKRQCLKKMFEKSMSSHKRLFLHWAQYNRTAKQIQACQLTADFFFALQKTVQAGIAPVLQNPREAQLKEYILKLMIQGQQGNLSHAFHKWKNTTAQDILSEDLQGEKKKFLIDKLQDFQTGNQKEQLRQILAKFAFAARRVRLVKDINLKLMKTFGGQVFDSFNKWKSIPQAPQNNAKASKFEQSLLKISIKFWRHNAWNPLQEAYDDALAIKKRAMLLLYKTQESEMQRTVTQWHHNIKLQDEVKRCKLVIFLFDQLNKTTKDNLGLLHQDEQSRKKEKALDKIQVNCNINLRDAFNKWRNNNQIARIQDALTFEKKKVLLETLDKFAHNSKNAQIRLILLRFKKNASIASIQDAFFKKLFQTKSGGLLNSFNKWKNLPIPKDNEALKKARKFERGLENLLHGSLKSTFDPLKELYYEALNAKRQCLKKMFEKSMSSHKRLFLHWAQYNRTAKQIQACQLTADFFFALQKTVQAGIAPVLQNPREAQLKEYILKLMIQGQQGNLSHAFHKWKNTTAQDILSEDLQGEKKKFLIDKLQDFQTGNQKEQLRQILAKFAFAARRVRLVKDINLKLMKTFGGQVFDSFNKWKSIPQAPQNHARASKFEQSLLKISIKFWRHNAWNPLQEAYDDALAIKKRAMLLLYKTQESEMQRTVIQWHHNIKLQDEVKRCKLVIFLFDQLSKTTKDNLGLLHQDEQSRKKEKALDKIQANCSINLRDAFNKWRNNNQIARIQDALTFEKKKVLLETLDKFAHNSKNAQIRLILLRFKKNASIASIQDAFFKKLFQTKSGGLLNSFNKWKNLPIPKDNEALKKARKFERGLENLLHGSLKSTFDPLKELYYEALNAKRQCLKKMFEKSMSSHKRLFLHWAQYNRTAKQIQACQLTADFFFALQKTVQAGIAPVLQNPREAQLKEYILKLMIQGQQGNLSHAFHKWKNTTAQDILSEDLQGEKKKFLIDKLQDFQTGNQKEQLRQILAKFAFAARRVRLVKDINLKLMKTFGGQVFDSFNRWKSIPQAPQNNAKASKFEHALLKISIKFWKHNAWNPLQEAYDDALAIKKRAMLLLYKTQESEMQRTVTQWHHNIKLQDEVKRCKLVIFLFDQLSKTTKDNLGLLHQDEQSRKKEKALDKIQANCNINLRDAFNKWRNNNQIARIQDALTFEKKKVLLETLDKFAHNSKNAQIRLILLRFKKNASISSIQDAFFKKLFQTKAGGLLNSFNKWKNLPIPKDNEALKKARKFERGLENLLHGSLKKTFDPLKEVYFQALNQKRYCVRKLFEAAMGSSRSRFIQWKDVSRNQKQILQCKKTTEFVLSIQNLIIANLSPMLKSNQIKLRALEKMMSNQNNQLRAALIKWKNVTETDKISRQLNENKRRFLLEALQQYNKHNQNQKYRMILAKFQRLVIAEKYNNDQRKIDELKKLLQEWEAMFKDSFQKWKETKEKLDLLTKKWDEKAKQQILETLKLYIMNRNHYKLKMTLKVFKYNATQKSALNKFFLAISATKTGQLMKSFDVWKSIPQDNTQFIKKCSIFETQLLKLVRRPLKQSFSTLEDINYDALNRKRRMIMLLLRSQEGGLSQIIKQWSHNVGLISENIKNGVSAKKQLAIQLFAQHKLCQLNQAFKDWRAINRDHNQVKEKKETPEERKHRLMKQAILAAMNYYQRVERNYFDQWRDQTTRARVILKCQAIQKMLHLDRFAERAIKKYVMDKWRVPRSQNPWFKRVAQLIAKNSRITPQISFWRMRDNAFTSGASMSTLKIIKCKKMFNNLRKAYDRNLTKAFMTIEHYGRPNTENSYQPSQASFIQQTPNKDLLSTRSQYDIQKNSQHLAVHSIARIFKQHLKELFEGFVLNGSQSSQINNSLLRSSIQPMQFKFINKQMASEKLFSVLAINVQRKKQKFFDQSQTQSQNDQELLQRMNALLQENAGLRTTVSSLQSQADNEQGGQKDQIINQLSRRLDDLLIRKLVKALEAYQDYKLEEAFIAISEL